MSLGGEIATGRYEDGKIDFEGSISLLSDFSYALGPITAVLKQGGTLKVCVLQSAFEWAELEDIRAEVDIVVGDSTLSLGGEITSGKYDKDGNIDLEGSIELLSDFNYTLGPITAVLKAGGKLTVKIEQSEFQWAELTEIGLEVDITVGDSTLSLGGEITQGKYDKDGMIDFEGSIELLSDFDYALGPIVAVLKAGGKLTVKVTQSEFDYAELSDINAEITINIGDMEIKLGGQITSGKYDKDGTIDLDASIELLSPVVLFESGAFKATLTSASVGVVVEKSELKTITAEGRADLEVEAGEGNEISGYLEIKWTNEGGENKFSGTGELTISMIEGKLTGTVEVELKEDGGWNIKGELDYQMNKFIGGKIGIEMDENLDPVLSGELRVENIELIPGRDLFSLKVPIIPWINTTIVIVAVPITLGFGVDFAFKVSLLPVLFSASINIENFRPLHATMPDFEARADLTTGLNVSLALEPYATLGIGIGGVLDAGFRLQGGIRLDAPITVNPYLILRGRDGKFSGELGVNVAISPSVVLSVEGLIYAAALGQSIEWGPDFLKYEKEFSDLFSYEWNAAYKFGDEGNETGTSAEGPSGEVQGDTEQAEEMTEGEDSGLEGFGEPETVQDDPEGPVLDEESTKKDEPEEGPMAEFQQKMAEAQEWAEHLGKVANLIGFVVSAVTLGLTLIFLIGPLAYPVALVIALILAGGPDEIMAGIDSLMWLLEKGAEILWSLMPDWVKDVKEIVDGGAVYAADQLYEWGAGYFDGNWWPVFEPIFSFLKAQAESFVQAIAEMDGSMEGFVRGLVALIVSAASGVLELIDAVGECLDQLVKLVQRLTYDGDITAYNMNPDDWGKDPWHWDVDIPGLYTGNGEGDDLVNWGIGNGLAIALKDVFGCTPNTENDDFNY